MCPPQLFEGRRWSVTTEADSTSSPPTYAVTDLRHIGGNTTDDALAIRDTFKECFVSPQGAVDWQKDMIRKGPWFFVNYSWPQKFPEIVNKCLNLYNLFLYTFCFPSTSTLQLMLPGKVNKRKRKTRVHYIPSMSYDIFEKDTWFVLWQMSSYL
jgi:hypothetical protein